MQQRTSGENYVGDWTLRMMDREDILDANAGIDAMTTSDAWLAYVDRMHMRDKQQVLSSGQAEALQRGRDDIVDALAEQGLRPAVGGRWRGKLGRFVARSTARSIIRRLFLRF